MGQAFNLIYLAIKACIYDNDEDINRYETPSKIYNTLLKTRYAVENNLLTKGNYILNLKKIDVLSEVEKLLSTLKADDVDDASFTVWRFLKSVIEMAYVIIYLVICLVYQGAWHCSRFHGS